MYKLDRTAFRAQTFKNAETSYARYYKKLTWQERLRISMYLNSAAFNFPLNNPPRIDKTKFKATSRRG